jgi:hypothetical protein
VNQPSTRSTVAAAIMLALGVSTRVALAAAEPPAPTGACALVTQAQVTAAFGLAVEPGTRPVDSDPSICNWREQGKPLGPGRNVMITVIEASRFDAAKAKLPKAPPQPNLDLGDDAFFEKSGRFPVNLFLKKGTQYFRIMARTQVTPATGVETADDADKAVEKKLAAQILKQL